MAYYSSRNGTETVPTGDIYEPAAAGRPALPQQEHVDLSDYQRFQRDGNQETAAAAFAGRHTFQNAVNQPPVIGDGPTGLSETELAIIEDLRAGRLSEAQSKIRGSQPRPTLEQIPAQGGAENAAPTKPQPTLQKETTVVSHALETSESAQPQVHLPSPRFTWIKVRVVSMLGIYYFFYIINWTFFDKLYMGMVGSFSRLYLSKVMYDIFAILFQILAGILVASPKLESPGTLLLIVLSVGTAILLVGLGLALESTQSWYTTKKLFGALLGAIQGVIPPILVYVTASWCDRTWRDHRRIFVLLYLFLILGLLVSVGLRRGLYDSTVQKFRLWVLMLGGSITVAVSFVLRVESPDEVLEEREAGFLSYKTEPLSTKTPRKLADGTLWFTVLLAFLNGSVWPLFDTEPAYTEFDVQCDIGSVLVCAGILIIYAVVKIDSNGSNILFISILGINSVVTYSVWEWERNPTSARSALLFLVIYYRACSFATHVVIVVHGMKNAAGESAKQNATSMLLFVAPKINRIIMWGLWFHTHHGDDVYSIYRGVNLGLLALLSFAVGVALVF